MGCLKRQVYLYMVPNLLNQHYMKAYFIIEVIIRCNFFFLFIGLEPTAWPANNCLQIMVCSCATSSNCVWLSIWLQIIFCSCANESTLFSFLWSWRYLSKNLLSNWMIKQLLNSVDNIAYEQTIICRQLFAGHVVGPRQMKRKKH